MAIETYFFFKGIIPVGLVKGTTSVTFTGSTMLAPYIYGNIYGGGNMAQVSKDTHVNIYAANFAGQVFGGGNGNISDNTITSANVEVLKGMTPYSLLATQQWKDSYDDNDHPHFSVFGGGYGVNTKVRNTDVKAQPGSIKDRDIRYLNQKSDMKIFQTFIDKLYSDFQAVSSEDKKKYYGSVDGTESDPNTFRRYYDSRMSWCLGIPNFTFLDIHGGGFAGYVEENTNVTANNRLACNNIYGAGLGAKPYGTLSADSNTDDYDFGSVKGNSYVDILAGCVSKNVYGGGAGVESILLADNSFADFKNMARVKGRTEVHVTGEMIGSAPRYHNRTLIIVG